MLEIFLSSLASDIAWSGIKVGFKSNGEKLSIVLRAIDSAKGIQDDFQEIKEELDILKGFLEDVADRKTQMADNKVLMNEIDSWEKHVRQKAYKVEDLMDEFKNLAQSRSAGGFLGSVDNISHYPKHISIAHGLASEIRKVKDSIREIAKKRHDLQLPTASRQKTHNNTTNIGPGFSIPYKVESLVGMDQNKDKLIELLLHDEQQRTVVSICGMPGLGKTTLANEVFNDPEVRKSFKHQAWITVSQSDNLADILKSIQKQLLPKSSSDESEQTIIDILSHKSYLIVLDDVWEFDAWTKLTQLIPNNNLRSRIVLTTRNQTLNSSSISNYVINLQPLEHNDARALFHMHAFKDGKCPPELENSAEEITKKCGGLPIALVAIGHVMSLEGTSEGQWQRTSNYLHWELSNNEILGTMARTLMLSYNRLPHHLKRCFLYCSLFPAGHLIKTNWLVKLFIAEGFIDQNEGRMEDIAEKCISQLCNLSMFQVIKKDESGRPRSLRVHEFMREMATMASKGENRCIDSSDQPSRVDIYCRRVSILKSICGAHANLHFSALRTLLVFAKDPSCKPSLLSICSQLKLLRVLELRGALIDAVPNNVFKLRNLRYLSLRETNVSNISPKVKKLQNLQTLDLWKTNVEKMPREILRLQKLRHLFMENIDAEEITYQNVGHILRGEAALSNIWELKSLQSLRSIKATDGLVSNIGNLVELRSLGITMLDEKHGNDLCNSLSKMKYLTRLSVRAKTKQFLTLGTLSSPPPHLEKLILNGHLRVVPTWFSHLRNLRQLYIFGSQLNEEDNPIPSLQELQNLVTLELDGAYNGKYLVFGSGKFHKLAKLSLTNLENLCQLKFERGTMPKLQQLNLYNLKNLKDVQGKDHLPQLQDFCQR